MVVTPDTDISDPGDPPKINYLHQLVIPEQELLRNIQINFKIIFFGLFYNEQDPSPLFQPTP